MNLRALSDGFRAAFGREPEWLVRAPGRVNLIGEHTDYNLGLVLPMAVDRYTWMAVASRQDGVTRALSTEFNDLVSFQASSPSRGTGWGEYLKGVAWAMADEGLPPGDWDGLICSDLPTGGGLSSSAALELAAARAFVLAGSGSWDGRQMAARCQRAEQLWVGVHCGIMDQLAVAEGMAGHAMLIDCQDLAVVQCLVPVGYAIVVMDTGTRRDLASSAYDARQLECFAAAARLGVASLRDADMHLLERDGNGLPPNLMRRARHVVTENARTRAAALAMASGDSWELGRLMNASHASLRDDFEASTPQLNIMVELAVSQPACAGARLTGAGFGGCAVALVDAGETARFCRTVAERYEMATAIRASIRVCAASDGVIAVPWSEAASLMPTQSSSGA